MYVCYVRKTRNDNLNVCLLKPRPHQQQCPSNIVECYKLNDSFDNVECCFDIVEKTKFRSTLLPKMATLSKQPSILSKGRHFTIESFDFVAVCGNKVECCFDKVEHSLDNVACCFDIVAGVDGALNLRTHCL